MTNSMRSPAAMGTTAAVAAVAFYYINMRGDMKQSLSGDAQQAKLDEKMHPKTEGREKPAGDIR